MSILKTEPPGHVASSEELLAIAHAMEREAGRRYRELAGHMRRQDEQPLAVLFDFLARIEDKHAEGIDDRATIVTGKPVDPTSVRWDLPENFDEEEARSHLLTPYRALAIAVRNEERAFAFFTYLAAHAENNEVRRLAEESAKDELDHAALLRRERRRAWRSQHQETPGRPEAEKIASVAELLMRAAAIERAAAAQHRVLAATLAAKGDHVLAGLFEQAAADEQATADEAAARLGSAADAVGASGPAEPARTIRDGLRLLEDTFERYAHVSEASGDEALMIEAQTLAQRALRRLTYTKGSIDTAMIEAP